MADERDGKDVTRQESVVAATAYPYANEVLVEVTCRDAEDHLVVYSYAFDPVDEGHVTAVEEIPERHETVVRDALDEKGYESGRDVADA